MSKAIRTRSSQDLSAGSLTHDLVIGTGTPNVEGVFRLSHASVKAASNINQNVTLSVISVGGANYTTEIDHHEMTSETDYTHTPDGDIILRRGDTVRLQCENTGTPSVVVYSEIQVERV